MSLELILIAINKENMMGTSSLADLDKMEKQEFAPMAEKRRVSRMRLERALNSPPWLNRGNKQPLSDTQRLEMEEWIVNIKSLVENI